MKIRNKLSVQVKLGRLKMVNSIDRAMFLKRSATFPRHLKGYLWYMEIHIIKGLEISK